MITYIILTLILLTGFIIGIQQWINFETLNRRRALGILGGIVGIIILSGLLTISGLLDKSFARVITAGIYLLFAGYFFGATLKMLIYIRRAGPVEYIQPGSTLRYIPDVLALLVIIYGLFRTNVLSTDYSTLLSWCSGISLISFGLYSWRLRILPEFRERGMLVLDIWIPWKQMISYEWHTEHSIRIDYRRSNNHISEIKTAIPPDDQLLLERLLRKKMDEFGTMGDQEADIRGK